jgi:hypothetical protein
MDKVQMYAYDLAKGQTGHILLGIGLGITVTIVTAIVVNEMFVRASVPVTFVGTITTALGTTVTVGA